MMTWLSPGESGGRLSFARLSGRAWSRPITIAENVAAPESGDRSSLTVMDTQAVRRTLIARTGDVVSRSGDGGRTWSRLPAPALPFASFAGGDEGGYVFWLDANGKDSARLLGSRILAGESLLDEPIWYRSGTGSAMTWDGPVVAYRTLSKDGGLDVAVISRQDAQWTRPRVLHAEKWRPASSTQANPQVAALRRHVTVVWYTEAQNRPRVLAAFSSDAGQTFSAPVEVDVAGRDRKLHDAVGVALDDSGEALVLWTVTTGIVGAHEATLNLARVAADGRRGDEVILAKGIPARLGGFPQIARAGKRVAVTWMEGVLRRVRAAAVPLDGIPAVRAPASQLVATPKGPVKRKAGRGKLGDPAPEIELVSLDGEKVSLASLRGRAVLLNLWATWCVPCLEEMPELGQLQKEYGPKGLAVVGVSVDAADASDQVRAFVSKLKIPFAIWLDPEMRIAEAVRVRAMPATFVIDREGRIVFRRNRAITANDPELRKALSSAVNNAPVGAAEPDA